MSTLPQNLTLPMMQNRWATELNPIISLPMLQGTQLKNVALVAGVNTVNHLLQRTQQGWILTDQTGPATIYRSQPFNNLTLTLTSSAACTVNIWVY